MTERVRTASAFRDPAFGASRERGIPNMAPEPPEVEPKYARIAYSRAEFIKTRRVRTLQREMSRHGMFAHANAFCWELGWYRDNAAYPNSVSAVFAAERFIVHDGRPYIP